MAGKKTVPVKEHKRKKPEGERKSVKVKKHKRTPPTV